MGKRHAKTTYNYDMDTKRLALTTRKEYEEDLLRLRAKPGETATTFRSHKPTSRRRKFGFKRRPFNKRIMTVNPDTLRNATEKEIIEEALLN